MRGWLRRWGGPAWGLLGALLLPKGAFGVPPSVIEAIRARAFDPLTTCAALVDLSGIDPFFLAPFGEVGDAKDLRGRIPRTGSALAEAVRETWWPMLLTPERTELAVQAAIQDRRLRSVRLFDRIAKAAPGAPVRSWDVVILGSGPTDQIVNNVLAELRPGARILTVETSDLPFATYARDGRIYFANSSSKASTPGILPMPGLSDLNGYPQGAIQPADLGPLRNPPLLQLFRAGTLNRCAALGELLLGVTGARIGDRFGLGRDPTSWPARYRVQLRDAGGRETPVYTPILLVATGVGRPRFPFGDAQSRAAIQPHDAWDPRLTAEIPPVLYPRDLGLIATFQPRPLRPFVGKEVLLLGGRDSAAGVITWLLRKGPAESYGLSSTQEGEVGLITWVGRDEDFASMPGATFEEKCLAWLAKNRIFYAAVAAGIRAGKVKLVRAGGTGIRQLPTGRVALETDSRLVGRLTADLIVLATGSENRSGELFEDVAVVDSRGSRARLTADLGDSTGLALVSAPVTDLGSVPVAKRLIAPSSLPAHQIYVLASAARGLADPARQGGVPENRDANFLLGPLTESFTQSVLAPLLPERRLAPPRAVPPILMSFEPAGLSSFYVRLADAAPLSPELLQPGFDRERYFRAKILRLLRRFPFRNAGGVIFRLNEREELIVELGTSYELRSVTLLREAIAEDAELVRLLELLLAEEDGTKQLRLSVEAAPTEGLPGPGSFSYAFSAGPRFERPPRPAPPRPTVLPAIRPFSFVDPRTSRVASFAFSPAGPSLAVGSSRGVVTIRSLSGEGAAVRIDAHPEEFAGVSSLAFSPDGTFLATTNGYRARLWRADGTPVKAVVPRRLRGRNDGSLGEVAFSPDGSQLAVATPSGVRLFDGRTGEPRRQFGEACTRVRFFRSGEETLLFVLGYSSREEARTLQVWSPATGRFRSEQATGREIAFAAAAPVAAATDPIDGRATLYRAARPGGGLRALRQIREDEDRQSRTASRYFISVLAVDPQGRSFVTAGGAPDAKLWQRSGDERYGRLEGRAGSAAYSPDGLLIATANGAGVSVFDAVTGARRARYDTFEYVQERVEFSPDGRYLVSLDGGTLYLLDLQRLGLLR